MKNDPSNNQCSSGQRSDSLPATTDQQRQSLAEDIALLVVRQRRKLVANRVGRSIEQPRDVNRLS